MHQPIDSQRIEELAAEQAAQEVRLSDVEARIARLEEAAARQVPWRWPQPTWPDITKPMLDGDPRCGVCGGRYADMTHYVCSHPQCPSRITCGDPLPGSPGYVSITCGTQPMAASELRIAKDIHPPRFGDSVFGR